MELIKKHHQKIISYLLIIIGPLSFLIFLIMHVAISNYWCSIFFIVTGLTLLCLAEDKK